MARRKFAKLKNLMFEREITQAEAAKKLGCGLAYLSHRLNGHFPFTFHDAEILSEMLDIPREEWADYFTDKPKIGV